MREKSTAAYKAGLSTVFIPYENVPDLEKIDKTVAEKLQFVPVKTVSEILNAVLLPTETSFAAEDTPLAGRLPVKKTTAIRETEMC